MKLSVVIPVYNEEDNIKPMIAALKKALSGMKYEVIFVDDGSADKTVATILSSKAAHIRLIQFSRNFGQTSAMAAGIQAARGQYIATMDGDLQNDPEDIPLMMEKLEKEKLDMVAGRREKRQDNVMFRILPSKIANMLIRKVSKVQISDYGCTLKLFKAELAKELDLYGELHRFIPILVDMNGAKIAEMDVRHHPRQFGVTKYGLSRTLKVASDLLLMSFFIRYRQRPMHLFGGVGLGMFMLGSAIEGYLLLLKLMGHDIGTRPLFFVGILLILTSVQLITVGFLAELQMRTYYESQRKKPYKILREYEAGKEVS